MARTVVYPERQVAGSGDAEIHFGGATPKKERAGGTDAEPVDDYAGKLTKLIPAETVAFFAPIAALVKDRPSLLVTAAGIGLLATPVYLSRTARHLPAKKRPRKHYYLLASLAFLIWATATSPLGTFIGLDVVETSFLLGVSVFVIPLADMLLSR